jgi:hypothetical protein
MRKKQRLTAPVAALCAIAAALSPVSAAVQDDVRTATVDVLQAKMATPRENIHVSYVSVAGRWGFVSWKVVHVAAGDTVMQQTDGVWHVFGQASPTLTLRTMVRFGVPPALATALLAGACPVPARSEVAGYVVTSVAVRRFDGNGKRVDTTTPCHDPAGTHK